MKLYTKGTLILLAGAVLTYSSCQKDNSTAPKTTTTGSTTTTTTTTTTTSPDAATVASAVGVNLTSSLSGGVTGSSISYGLTPATTSASLCGFVADSTIHYTTNIGDTIKAVVAGKSQFYFDCANGFPTGYTLTGELVSIGIGPGYGFTYDDVQGYRIIKLNTAGTLFGADGALKAFKDITYVNRAYKPLSEHDSFVLTNCVISIVYGKSHILSGKATFTTVGSNSAGSWNYTGTLTFLGNDLGKMAFEGHVFLVNLITGKSVLVS